MTLADLADAVTATPADWIVVESLWDRVSHAHGLRQPRQTSPHLRELLIGAFAAAHARGFLDVFALELVKAGLAGSTLIERVRAHDEDAGGFALQAFQNGRRQAVNPLLYAQDLLRACDRVCRIDVDGAQAGTGVLVRPTIVATMAHVVWPLVTCGPDGTLAAAPGSLSRLTIRFRDYVTRAGAPSSGGDAAALHPGWLLHASPATDAERAAGLDVRDIAGIADPAGPWDLALIRLAAPPRGVHPQETPFPELVLSPPAGPFEVSLLHHPHGPDPDGEPLLLSGGSLDEQLGTPPVRYLHDVNTLAGSSGAPLFDQRWRVVALHQGGVAGERNRAVPVRPWCVTLDRMVPDEVPYLRSLRRARDLTTPYPVIGRRATQQRVWRALRPDAAPADRLFIVRGAPGTGRRFTKRLVREFVETHSDGVVVTLDLANVLAHSAGDFARWIMGALSAPAGHARPDASPATGPRDIRDGVLPALTRRIEETGGDRPVWLVLDGFGDAALDVPPGVKDVVVALMDGLRGTPTLRLVLAGWGEPPPQGAETAVEDLAPPTAQDIAALLSPPGEHPPDELVGMVSVMTARQAAGGLTGYPAAHDLLQRLTGLFDAGQDTR